MRHWLKGRRYWNHTAHGRPAARPDLGEYPKFTIDRDPFEKVMSVFEAPERRGEDFDLDTYFAEPICL